MSAVPLATPPRIERLQRVQRRVAAVVGGGRPPLQVQLNSAQQRSSDAKRPLTSSQQPHVDTASANSAAHSAATPHPQPALCYSAVRVRLFVRLCGCSVAAAAASDGRLAAAEAARGKRQAARQQRAYTTQRSHSAPSARSTVFLHPLRADARGCCCVSLFAVRATREWAERLQVADAVDAAKRRARASGGGGADGRSAAAAPLRLSHRASPSTAAAASPQLGSVAAAVASAASSDGREAKTKAVALQQAMQRAQQNDGERQAQAELSVWQLAQAEARQAQLIAPTATATLKPQRSRPPPPPPHSAQATVQRASSAHQHALKQPTCGDSRDEEICLPCPSPLLSSARAVCERQLHPRMTALRDCASSAAERRGGEAATRASGGAEAKAADAERRAGPPRSRPHSRAPTTASTCSACSYPSDARTAQTAAEQLTHSTRNAQRGHGGGGEEDGVPSVEVERDAADVDVAVDAEAAAAAEWEEAQQLDEVEAESLEEATSVHEQEEKDSAAEQP